MAQALDMALDDLVNNSKGGRGKGRGQGKGSGKSWSKGRFAISTFGKGGRGKGKKGSSGEKAPDLDGKKLDMSLDEVIEKSLTKGKSKGKKKGEDWETKGKSRGEGKGKGKSDWNYNSRSDGGYSKGGYEREKGNWTSSWSTKGKGYKSSGKGKSWEDGSKGADYKPSWDEHDDREGAVVSGRRRDDWEDDRKGGKGWSSSKGSSGRKGDFGFGERREVRSSGGRASMDSDGWQRVPQARERPIGSAPRKRPREESPDTKNVKAVKVTNIPRNVTKDDLQEAFEQEAGKITRCRLDRGTAWIAFTKAIDARKAVSTFDQGELNGNTIGVVLDP